MRSTREGSAGAAAGRDGNGHSGAGGDDARCSVRSGSLWSRIWTRCGGSCSRMRGGDSVSGRYGSGWRQEHRRRLRTATALGKVIDTVRQPVIQFKTTRRGGSDGTSQFVAVSRSGLRMIGRAGTRGLPCLRPAPVSGTRHAPCSTRSAPTGALVRQRVPRPELLVEPLQRRPNALQRDAATLHRGDDQALGELDERDDRPAEDGSRQRGQYRRTDDVTPTHRSCGGSRASTSPRC